MDEQGTGDTHDLGADAVRLPLSVVGTPFVDGPTVTMPAERKLHLCAHADPEDDPVRLRSDYPPIDVSHDAAWREDDLPEEAL